MSLGIFLTIWVPLWLYVLLFLNFSILDVLAPHFRYILFQYEYIKCWTKFGVLLNPVFWNVGTVYASSTFTRFLLLTKKGKLKITNSTSGAWKKQMKKCSSGAHGVGQCTWLFSSYRALDKCPLSFSKHWFYTENPCWMILTAVFVNMTYLLSRYFSLRHSYSWIVCIWFRILHV